MTSPYLRTQQTTKPTIKRFRNVPVEVWPIQEFTYLEPSQWKGTSSALRSAPIQAYWKTCNPAYCDGPGAESFASLLRRTEAALSRLEALPHDALVYVFSHGQFMQALRSTVTDNGTTANRKWNTSLIASALPPLPMPNECSFQERMDAGAMASMPSRVLLFPTFPE